MIFFEDKLKDPYQVSKADRLSVSELNRVKRYTIQGLYGNGDERMEELGRWYRIVQDMVNGDIYRREEYLRLKYGPDWNRSPHI